MLDELLVIQQTGLYLSVWLPVSSHPSSAEIAWTCPLKSVWKEEEKTGLQLFGTEGVALGTTWFLWPTVCLIFHHGPKTWVDDTDQTSYVHRPVQ